MSHLTQWHRDTARAFASATRLDDDDREELRRMDRAAKAKHPDGACQCFAPGEAGGTCPGPANCPMCDDEDPTQ